MILVLERGTSPEELQAILSELRALGLGVNVLGGQEKPLVHVTSGRTRKARRLLRRNERVQALIPTSGPRIRREGRRFFPYHFINWCAGGLILVGVLVVLTGFFPPGVGADFDPRRPLTPSESMDATPWYLRAPAMVLALVPAGLRWLGWLALAVVVILVALLPMLDRSGSRAVSRAPVLLFGAALAVAYVGLTVWGMR